MDAHRATATCSSGIAVLRARIAGAAARRRRDERGAALVLALVFLVVAALTLTALVSFAGSGLLDAGPLTAERGLQYGANGATEIAIQRVRYQTTGANYYPALKNCLGTATTSSVSLTEWQATAQYRVYCQGQKVQGTLFSGTAAVDGGTVTTSRLFSVYNPSFIGYGIVGTGIPPDTSIVAETTTSHTATMSQSTHVHTTETITLVSPFQRMVTFYTCKSTACVLETVTHVRVVTPASVLVKAVVGFGDRTGANTVPGRSLIVEQWTVSRANN